VRRRPTRRPNRRLQILPIGRGRPTPSATDER
jgi:hypothetical protein